MPPNGTALTNSPPNSQTKTDCDEKNIKKLTVEATGVLFEGDAETYDGGLVKDIEKLKHAENRKLELVWRNIIFFVFVHVSALYGAWLILTSAKWATGIFGVSMTFLSGQGVTAGAHRLWAHRSYKAKWPLRLILVILNLIAFQDSIYHWARDHRVHHKYSETDADPHNATRGFFFSHVGWLLCKKHPEVKEKGKGIDMSDLRADPLVMFQDKYYLILMPLFCFVLTTLIPMYCWDETLWNSWFVGTILRWTVLLNLSWLINSAAHKYGGKPYDKHINPADSPFVAFFTSGEGWHNYHHVFPWDYKAAEFGKYSFNNSAAFINMFAKIGWAYDMKTVSAEIIERRVKRTGDGTHPIWGWGDKDQPKEDIDYAHITHRKKEHAIKTQSEDK